MNDFIGAIKSPSKERGRKSKRRTSLFVLYFQTVGKRKNEYRKIPLRYSLLTPGFTDGRMAHFRLKCCACNGNGDISPRYFWLFNHRKHCFAPRAQHRFTLVVRLGNADRHRVFLFRIRAVQKRSSATVHRTTRNGNALYFFALCSLCRFRDFHTAFLTCSHSICQSRRNRESSCPPAFL